MEKEMSKYGNVCTGIQLFFHKKHLTEKEKYNIPCLFKFLMTLGYIYMDFTIYISTFFIYF